MNNDASNSQSDSSKTIPDANNSELTSSVFDGIKTHLRAFCLGALGVLSAAIIPIWQIYFVQTSDVMIEIASISREESANYMVPLDTDELQLLEPYIPEALLYEFNHLGQRGDKI